MLVQEGGDDDGDDQGLCNCKFLSDQSDNLGISSPASLIRPSCPSRQSRPSRPPPLGGRGHPPITWKRSLLDHVDVACSPGYNAQPAMAACASPTTLHLVLAAFHDTKFVALQFSLCSMPFKASSRASLRPFLGFFFLLFYAEPTWLDCTFLCVGFIAAIAAGVPFPLIGIIFGQLVDDFNTATCNDDSPSDASSGTQGDINDKILLMVYIAIGSFVLIYTHIVCWNLASQRLAQRIRERYLKSLLRQDISFFDKLQAGEVSSRLNGDIQAIETGTSEKVGVFLTCVSFCVTAYVIAFIKDPKLAGMLISLVPAFLFMTVLGGHYVQKYSSKMADHFASASAIASEGLRHVGLVHALGANSRLEDKFGGYLFSARKEGTKKALAAAVQAGLLYFIALSANALAYWQGSRKIANTVEFGGDATVGETYTVIFVLVDGERHDPSSR